MTKHLAVASPWAGADIGTIAELGEANAYLSLVNGAPSELRREFGLKACPVGSGVALVASGFANSLVLNRVLGLGVAAPVSTADLDQIDDLYRGSGVASYAIELSPGALPAEMPQDLLGRGFVPFKRTTLMARDCAPIDETHCPLQIHRVSMQHADAFAALCCDVFGYAAPMPLLLSATFDSNAWQHWMAFDGRLPVAAAMTHLQVGTGWIGWVCTRREHRGRGAQTALAAAQLRGAAEAGITLITLEAATGSKAKPGPSLRNYQRLGWAAIHDRTIFLRRPQ